MKKLSFASMAILLILMLTLTLAGCPQSTGTEGGDPNNTTNNSGTNNGGSTNNGGGTGTNPTTPTSGLTAAQIAAFQTSINTATAGSTVNLSAGTVPANSYITVAKALTINGNGIDGLTIKVSSAVTSNVTLKNFKNARLEVFEAPTNTTPSASSRMISIASDDDDEEANTGRVSKFGDDAVPLRLEGCEIEEFVAEMPVALFLGTGDERTSIEELKLRGDADTFTFIEDDEGLEDDEKSSVGKLYVQDGIDEINLIGGSFRDLDFADDITDPIAFNYDAEFEQFEDDSFFDESFIEQRDIAIAENEFAEGASGVYKFQMSLEAFNLLNGYISIVFLTDTQKTAVQTACNAYTAYNSWSTMTYDNPMYDVSTMGLFKVETLQEGLNVIHGRESSYLDWSSCFFGNSAEWVKTVYLDYYLDYSKDAVIVEKNGNTVTLYVDTAAIRKSDLMVRVCPSWMENSEEQDGANEGGSKLTKLNLEGYKPYFVISRDAIAIEHQDNSAAYRTQIKNSLTQTSFVGDISTNEMNWFEAPTSSDQKSFASMSLYPYVMETATSYPDVSSVVHQPVAVPDIDYANVHYYDNALLPVKNETVIKQNLNATCDPWEYYIDSNFEHMLSGVNCGHFNSNWEAFEDDDFTMDDDVVQVYARPRRPINFYAEWDRLVPENMRGDEPVLDERQYLDGIDFESEAYINLGASVPVVLWKNYDAVTHEYSNRITNPKQIDDTVYITYPKVRPVIVDTSSNNNPANNIYLEPALATSVLESIQMSAQLAQMAAEEPGTVNIPIWTLYQDQNLQTAITARNVEDLYYIYSETQPVKDVYFKVNVRVKNPNTDAVSSTISWKQLKDLVAAGGEYYSSLNEYTDTETGEVFTLNSYKYTAAKIQEFEEDIGWSSYFDAYDGRPNTTPITLTQITTTNTTNPQESIVRQILYDMAHSPDDFHNVKLFWWDDDKQEPLSAEDVGDIVEGMTIYWSFKSFNVSQTGSDGTEYQHVTREIGDLYTPVGAPGGGSLSEGYFIDAAKTQPITEEWIASHADGTTIYSN